MYNIILTSLAPILWGTTYLVTTEFLPPNRPLLVAAIRALPFTPTNLFGFVWLGVINTGFAYVLWFRGIERLDAPQVSFLGLLSPLVAILGGWLILNQTLESVQWIGVILILASIVVAQYPNIVRPSILTPRSPLSNSLSPIQK